MTLDEIRKVYVAGTDINRIKEMLKQEGNDRFNKIFELEKIINEYPEEDEYADYMLSGKSGKDEAVKNALKLREELENIKNMYNVINKRPETSPQPAPDTQTPETDDLQQSELDSVSAIKGYYPLFSSHYSELKKAQFIESNGTGLHWKKSKQSLAEYFDAIKPKDKSHNWKILENTFNVHNLRQAASQNGNPFKGKKSKDFMELGKIITVL